MATYKCGYCGVYNVNDIWCSENHRLLWYSERNAYAAALLKARPGRKGPQHQPLLSKKKERR